jgi:hypothetical protein
MVVVVVQFVLFFCIILSKLNADIFITTVRTLFECMLDAFNKKSVNSLKSCDPVWLSCSHTSLLRDYVTKIWTPHRLNIFIILVFHSLLGLLSMYFLYINANFYYSRRYFE